MRLQKEVSDRIAMLRPLLIIGVVFVHINGISDIPSELHSTLFNWFAAFFKNGVFRGTVPTMSLISGYLLFSSGLDQSLRKLFKKKFTTLVIPFIVFNLYGLAFMEMSNWAFGPVYLNLTDGHLSTYELISYIFGFVDMPINGPLHFVRDMIVAILLVPVLSIFLRNAPWIGLAALAIIFGTDMDGKLIFRASSLILFYVGGAAAVHKWNVLALDKYAKECLAIFAAACMVLIGFRIDDNTALVVIAPFLIWPSASLLNNTKIKEWALKYSKYSFFIFATHMPLLGTLWWIVTRQARWVPYPIYWFAAPILVVVLLKVVYDLAMKLAPHLFNFAIGCRADKPVLADRRREPRPVNAPIYSPELRGSLISS